MGLIALFQANTLLEKYWIKTWGEAYNTIVQPPQLFAFTTSVRREWSLSQSQGVFDVASLFKTPSNTFTFSSTQHLNATAAHGLPDASVHPLFYVSLYAAFVFLTALLRTCAAGGEYMAATIAGRRLFTELLTKIVKATMRWYDTTPSGRILNRFGKDIETLDDGVAQSIWIVNVEAMGLVAILAMISSIFPLFMIPAVAIGYLYFNLAVGYLNTGRDLRRMESNTRSPIFSDFSEVLEGIVTVRAFSAERRFLHNMHKKIDLTTKMNYMIWMTNRWLLIRFDVLGGLTVLLTTLFAVSGYVSAGTAGLCITSATSFTMSVYWLCRFWTKMELDLNSVERIVEYLDVPEEPPAVIEENRPPAYWPSSSSHRPLVQVEELNIKYAPDLPSVIHGVSFELKAGERIGLLGRTGSGKSTLAMSLLRFVEPAGGRIVIDGVDISSIGVSDLRSRLTFIPQDAALFSGTIRDNLDPFNEHDDGECLDVLHRVQILSDEDLASQHPSRAPSTNATPRGSTPDPEAPPAEQRRHGYPATLGRLIRPRNTAPHPIHNGVCLWNEFLSRPETAACHGSGSAEKKLDRDHGRGD
jgi:ABC-type multidrug transport system fused ATPase/permease subunit